MKLIDADKLELKHYVQGGDVLLGYAGTIPLYHYVDVIKEDINNAPTVEAIPIEWLHSIMKKQLIFAMESEMDGTTTVQDGVIHCVSGALACQVLANVIALWEKENEID